jgi:NNP family nitrate/nitrite transporter-like MFS transporter
VADCGCAVSAQLALDNALAPYFQNNFGFGITKAANLASIFGMFNFVARPLGGYMSDVMAHRFGMRGRIAWLFCVTAGGGEFLFLSARASAVVLFGRQ